MKQHRHRQQNTKSKEGPVNISCLALDQEGKRKATGSSPHATVPSHIRLVKRELPKGTVRLAEQGTLQMHSASGICQDGYMSVPWHSPELLDALHI